MQKMQRFSEIGEQLKLQMSEEEVAQFVINAMNQAEQKGQNGETNTAHLIL
jgi:hypothetical protein